MFITMKKHEARLEVCMSVSYNKGYEEGSKVARDEARVEFDKQLEFYNKVSVDSRVELRKSVDELAKELEKKETEIELAKQKVDSLEESLDKSVIKTRYAYEEVNSLKNKLNDSNKKVDILNTFLSIHYDKEVARYEEIIKRTKKFRIKKKAKSKILQLKMDRLGFER